MTIPKVQMAIITIKPNQGGEEERVPDEEELPTPSLGQIIEEGLQARGNLLQRLPARETHVP